jgi:hypothetical protein
MLCEMILPTSFLSLEAVVKFFEPILSDVIKERLKKTPKSSTEKARQAVFDLYHTLGEVQVASDAFVVAFEDYVLSIEDSVPQTLLDGKAKTVISGAQKMSNALVELGHTL